MSETRSEHDSDSRWFMHGHSVGALEHGAER